MELLNKIADCIVDMDEENIENILSEALKSNIPLDEIYKHGLNEGMLRATKLFENKEYYISEIIVCADTLNKGIQYLKKYGNVETGKGPTIVIGVVEGDMHEIGKNIVKIMLEAADFNVIDLGVNVTSQELIETAIKNDAKIIGLSSMMTTTMVHMGEVVEKLNERNLKNRPKVMIGGGCISQIYADEIKADGYSANAIEAVKLANKLLGA